MIDLPDEMRKIVGTVTGIQEPAQGDTSRVVIVESDQGRFVIKHAVGPQFDTWVEQEYRVLRVLQSTPLPVPRTFGLHVGSTQARREAWIVMEYKPGETVRTVLAREQDRATRDRVVQAWARALADLHATPPPPPLDPTRSWLDDTLAQATYNLEHFSVDGDHMLLDRLLRERPAPESQTLIHGDFTIDNTLVADGVMTGIIDWSGGAIGDPRYDLVLATERKRAIFGKRDYDVFWDSYGRAPLSKDEIVYFEGLYEFF